MDQLGRRLIQIARKPAPTFGCNTDDAEDAVQHEPRPSVGDEEDSLAS